MPPPPPIHLSVRVGGDDHAAKRARSQTIELLQEHMSAVHLRDVVLAVTELVTNAHRHGEPPVALSVTLDSGCTTIAVTDASRRMPQPADVPNLEGGFGLGVVSTIAQDWGTRVLPTGKAVWCTIVTPAS